MSNRTKTLTKYRELEVEGLDKEEQDLRNAIWKLKLQKGTGQIVDTHKLEAAKRDLARLMTVRREREAAAGARGRS
jgi:ribosomal protein L29